MEGAGPEVCALTQGSSCSSRAIGTGTRGVCRLLAHGAQDNGASTDGIRATTVEISVPCCRQNTREDEKSKQKETILQFISYFASCIVRPYSMVHKQLCPSSALCTQIKSIIEWRIWDKIVDRICTYIIIG